MFRLSERYISYQGEGPNTGKPTMFVRFAGCNFKCPGWPCDTPHAIDPKIFTKEQQLIEWYVLADRILGDPTNNICLTGGEPFLQDHDDLLHLLGELKSRGRTVEVFTNGSLTWPDISHFDNVIVDWKLPSSGEYPDEEILLPNIARLGPADAVKFTIKDRDDFDRALWNWSTVLQDLSTDTRPVVWCGPVWGSLTGEKLARWMTNAEVPWHLNTQVHKFIFGEDTRGV